MKTIDLNQKLSARGVVVLSEQTNYFKQDGQDFYYSPSGKMISLAEKLPNKDWWIVKTWRWSNVTLID